jgi:bifunctional UDP-N-acetylglucosamine pyrophosphorylase/glucosamine-1-phosphate N-acetyltransferase
MFSLKLRCFIYLNNEKVKKESNVEIQQIIDQYGDKLNSNIQEAAIILAAGHGKRIKSNISKMLHKIWGEPTAVRVHKAAVEGLENPNIVMVVGIKAEDVIKTIGKKSQTTFAYQEFQNGTGDAVRVGMEPLKKINFNGDVYIFPGDMGLLDKDTVKKFRQDFKNLNCDMLVMTGIYEGDYRKNYYGRIIRVPQKDKFGNDSGDDFGSVIEIMEQKDILNLSDDRPYEVTYKGKIYSFTKDELLRINEFNAGVYAVKFKPLSEHINKITSDNVQGEIYITDLISIFNKNGLKVKAVSPDDQSVVLGFNVKSVLKEMEAIARAKAYDKLKDIIEIDDPDDFFIADEVIEQILEMDKKGIPLDIRIGKGVYIGKNVKLNYGVELKKNVYVDGNVIFGKNVKVWENALLSTFPHQQFIIGDNVEILWGDIIKGNIVIGENSRIESSVNMTGSDEFPLRIGKNVLIKGTSYLFGTIVEDDVHIEHSILIKKKVERVLKKDGTVRAVRFYLPMPEGVDSVTDL